MGSLSKMKKYQDALSALDTKDFPLKRYLPAGLLVLDMIGRNEDRLIGKGLTNKLSELYGTQGLRFYLRIHQANKIVHALVGMVIIAFFGMIVRSLTPSFAGFSLGIVTVLYFLPDYELNRKIIERRRQIQMEFPDFITKSRC